MTEVTVKLKVEADGKVFIDADDLKKLQEMRILTPGSGVYISKDGRIR